MSATSGMMQLPGVTRVAGPLREVGSSALDRRATTWAPPDPATIFIDPWGPPQALNRIAGAAVSPWPAPLAELRVATLETRAVPMATIEPLHAVQAPDLAALARQHARERLVATRQLSIPTTLGIGSFTPMAPLDVHRPGLARPTLDQLVLSDVQALELASRPHGDCSGISGRLLTAVVVGVGVWIAAATVVFTLF